jgi:hypothetical protein
VEDTAAGRLHGAKVAQNRVTPKPSKSLGQ